MDWIRQRLHVSQSRTLSPSCLFTCSRCGKLFQSQTICATFPPVSCKRRANGTSWSTPCREDSHRSTEITTCLKMIKRTWSVACRACAQPHSRFIGSPRCMLNHARGQRLPGYGQVWRHAKCHRKTNKSRLRIQNSIPNSMLDALISKWVNSI